MQCNGRNWKGGTWGRRRPQPCASSWLSGSEPGMYGHRKLLKGITEVRCFTPARTVQNESRQSAGWAKKLTLPAFASGKRPGSARPRKSRPQLPEAGTHFWKTTRSLLGSPPATFVIFVAETWVVIQVGASK